ncbi:6-phosphofructo-2-kinase domain-containing protein [Lactococcus lactis]|uniref:Uncharacterized protein n=1 Tax=Lactococcus lactis subsp. lactis TaxID=1360 RepID=A0A2N5WA98_LACLL|nr:6-phosphofructo-2-kinase domain-containing protein [Lactococcus lactis]PLW59166.1 hypothetical protein CYU10_000004 [Lactococcus lactis subsp. lactis]
MKEKIKIDKSILFLSEKGYYNGELTIWGNKINADLEVWENNEFITKIMENISWINNNKHTILEKFLEKANHYIDSFNDMIRKNNNENHSYITLEEFKTSISIDYLSVYIRGNTVWSVMELIGEPDYLLGQREQVKINENYEVEYLGSTEDNIKH